MFGGVASRLLDNLLTISRCNTFCDMNYLAAIILVLTILCYVHTTSCLTRKEERQFAAKVQVSFSIIITVITVIII